MPVKTLFRGAKFAINLWINEDGDCPVEDYIRQLDDNNDPDGASILHLLERTAMHGLSQNEQKTRYIKGAGKNLIEFKARGGTRILAFIYQDNQLIICSHGIPKLKEKRFKREVTKLEEIQASYENE